MDELAKIFRMVVMGEDTVKGIAFRACPGAANWYRLRYANGGSDGRDLAGFGGGDAD